MPKDYSTDWFLEFIISASSFSFFLRWRTFYSYANSAFVFSRFFVFWID